MICSALGTTMRSDIYTATAMRNDAYAAVQEAVQALARAVSLHRDRFVVSSLTHVATLVTSEVEVRSELRPGERSARPHRSTRPSRF